MPLRVPSFRRTLQMDVPRPAPIGQWLVFKAVPRIIVVVLIYLTIFGPSGMIRRHRMVADLDKVKQHLEERQAENALLVREIQLLNEDKLAVERKITEELLLVPPSSTLYRFDDNLGATPAPHMLPGPVVSPNLAASSSP